MNLPDPNFSSDSDLRQKISRLERKATRERIARKEAERLLEEKSLELFKVNSSLIALNDDLEQTVQNRTKALQTALDTAEKAKKVSEHASMHDALTGLPNRRFLRLHFDKIMPELAQKDMGLALLHIDLDRFKQINDTLGHAAGDFLLVYVGKILTKQAGKDGFVARIGGDEFVILLPIDGDFGPAVEIGLSIVRKLTKPIVFEENVMRCGASIGIAHHQGADIDPGQLLVDADIALYRAKNAGRGVVEVFSPELKAELSHRKQLADDILTALEQNLFRPVYQPRIDAKTGRLICVEALARWDHPELGVLPPEHFISVAEDIGVIEEIDNAILDQSLSDLAKWQKIGSGISRVTVNVSYRRLVEPDLIASLIQKNITPGSIGFELLESTFLDDANDDIMQRIEAIKNLGIGVEIDDFGSGHASILSVTRLRPRAIKIDGSLVMQALTATGHEDLIRAIVDIGRALNVEVVAEGVETQDHVRLCRDLGCDQLQGFAISHPKDADLMAHLAKGGQFDPEGGKWV
ncbi:putative bifunctional diguanylate cyclase/phosphodiesterase [Aestuariibius sp. HNIBRBA575]|uniref:putative bifunctional diguanylate cyclase/phosphodiesterase n=1 Tax=Aestuariibius sp. HNIBRBA575 TaxID=3233343 RepID=UPI0034A127A9